MQNQSPFNIIYKSGGHCARAILQNEGKLAFYKGTMAPLVGVSFCTSIQFALNEISKKLMTQINLKRGKQNPMNLSPLQYIICGMVAGFGNATIATPVELVRITMQNQSTILDPRLRYNGSLHVVKSFIELYGLNSLY